MDELYRWINTIIVSIIFTDFVEMLMPSNAMKKYVRMILGVLVMAVILQPILGILKKDFSLDKYSFRYENELNEIASKKETDALDPGQSEAVVSQYKKNLAERMSAQIKSMSGGMDASVEADIVEDANASDFGTIKSIRVRLGGPAKPSVKVEKVEIGEGGGREASNGGDSEGFSDLKEGISSLYGVDRDSISIVYDSGR